MMKKWLSILISTLLILCCFPVSASALTSVYTNHSPEYRNSKYYRQLSDVVLSGNGADDMVAIAYSQQGYHEGNSTADYGGGNTGGEGNYCEYNRNYWKSDVHGSNYAWCTIFVAWCARQARQEAAVPGQGYVVHMYDKVIEAGGYEVAANQVRGGDLVFYHRTSGPWPHVGIMVNATQCIEGNRKNQVMLTTPGTYVYNSSESVARGNVKVVYVRPNYQGAIPPNDSTIRISGETVPGDIKHGSKFGVRGIISSGVPLTSVTGGVFTAANCGGTRLTGTTVSPNATSYNLSGAVNNAIVFNTLPVGTYWYCVSATNSGGTTVLINQQFSVLGESRPAAPGTPTVSVSNSKVTVSWNDVANETSYNVYLVQEPWGWEDISYSATVKANATSYTFTDVDPGDYAAFVISMPNDANIQSGWARFSVSAPAPIPTNCKVVTDKQEYTVGDTVTITPSASNAVGYAVSVRKREDTSIIVWSHFDAFTGSVTYTPTKAGEYVVWANALNADGKTNTEGMACDFTVQEKTPTPVNVKVITDKAVYQQGETVTITPSASNVSGFTLSVREGSSLGAIVFSKWDKFTVPVTFTPTNAGKYVVVISVFDLAGRDVTASDIPNPTCSFEVVAEEDTPDTPLDPTPENSFIDVPNGAYYAKSVNWAVDHGITAGTTQTTFSPNQPCTRAQAVTFLWRAAGSPKPQGSNTKFTDVTPGHYYTDAVQWAVENGITGGTTPTTFSPNDKCTRAQIVCFLHRFHHSPAPAGVSPFTDVPVSVYYSNSVAWAVENGITSGISSTQFGPFNDCSRGQIVTFLYRDLA